MGLVRSFIGTDGIWQYIPHINTGLFSIIKVHFLLFANLIVDWHINTINFTDSGKRELGWGSFPKGGCPFLNGDWGASHMAGRGRKNLTSPGNRTKMSHNTKKNLEEG